MPTQASWYLLLPDFRKYQQPKPLWYHQFGLIERTWHLIPYLRSGTHFWIEIILNFLVCQKPGICFTIEMDFWALITTSQNSVISNGYMTFQATRKTIADHDIEQPSVRPSKWWYHRVFSCRGMIGMPLFYLSNWAHLSWISNLVHAIMPIYSSNFKGSSNKWLQNQLLTIFNGFAMLP